MHKRHLINFLSVECNLLMSLVAFGSLSSHSSTFFFSRSPRFPFSFPHLSVSVSYSVYKKSKHQTIRYCQCTWAFVSRQIQWTTNHLSPNTETKKTEHKIKPIHSCLVLFGVRAIFHIRAHPSAFGFIPFRNRNRFYVFMTFNFICSCIVGMFFI